DDLNRDLSDVCSVLSSCAPPRPRLWRRQESIVEMRRRLLARRFVKALTQGQSSVRPIEMQAHDPVR
ncbi:unnamed protein product, partial [Laminaria digitata]